MYICVFSDRACDGDPKQCRSALPTYCSHIYTHCVKKAIVLLQIRGSIAFMTQATFFAMTYSATLLK